MNKYGNMIEKNRKVSEENSKTESAIREKIEGEKEVTIPK